MYKIKIKPYIIGYLWLNTYKKELRKIILDLKELRKLKALHKSGVVVISMGDLRCRKF